MVSKEEIKNVLRPKVGQYVKKSELQKELQNLLNTKNRFERGDDNDPEEFSLFFTNGEAHSTSNFCDIVIDYLKTNKRGIIYVNGFEILNYYA